MFSRVHFERIADALNITSMTIQQIATPDNLFTGQARLSLKEYGGVDPDELPPWGWDILRKFDEEHCSPELKQELTLEGIVTFVR